MTSEIPFISKLIHKPDQSLLEHVTPNGALPNRLLSPITETSAEIHSISLPINKTYSDISQKSPNIVLTNNNPTIDELNQLLCQRFDQYTTNFQHIQNYLNTFDQHFRALSFLIQYLRNDKNLTNIIELIETRLLQMRVKRDQIDHLLNHSSIKNIIQQISPFVYKTKLNIDYHEFLTSIQLSLNQKTVLLDHLKNEYRYRKYEINEYSSKFSHQYQLLLKLTKQIEEYLAQYNKRIKQVHHRSLCNEHNRQCMDLINLSNEYEQLQNENHFLTLKVKENIQKLSLFIQSNHH